MPKSVVTYRRVETRLRETRPERFVPYAAQWIALEGEQIIANGQNLREVIQQARAQGVPSPYVFYVQSNTELAKITL